MRMVVRRLRDPRVRDYDRERGNLPHRVKAITANTKRWRRKNPEKYKAHNIVNNAIRDGKLSKGTCEVCGSDKVHAHHDDYSRPLDVRWRCAIHHQHIHHDS